MNRSTRAAAITAVVASVSVLASVAPAHATERATVTTAVSCQAGKAGWFEYTEFRGEATVQMDYDPGADRMRAEVLQYRITPIIGSSGGDSANVNVDQGGNWARSADAMKQDGRWHPLNIAVTGDGDWGRVQFIFDQSGVKDPRCTASYHLP